MASTQHFLRLQRTPYCVFGHFCQCMYQSWLSTLFIYYSQVEAGLLNNVCSRTDVNYHKLTDTSIWLLMVFEIPLILSWLPRLSILYKENKSQHRNRLNLSFLSSSWSPVLLHTMGILPSVACRKMVLVIYTSFGAFNHLFFSKSLCASLMHVWVSSIKYVRNPSSVPFFFPVPVLAVLLQPIS